MDWQALRAAFPPEAVHWRPQGTPFERNGKFSCMALAYIDARDVQDRLDEVCRPDGWQNEITETAKGRVLCRIGIRGEDGDWIWKGDGAGDTDVEGEKGGISDSMKRAAVAWGIGRYLYRLKSPWVQCEVNQKNGKTYWKRWAVDPWTCVQAPVQETSQANAPQFDRASAGKRIMAAIAKAPTDADLTDLWKREADTVKQIGGAGEQKIIDTFKARKAAINEQKDAA